MRAVAVVLSCLVSAGCSAEAVEPAEPGLRTPGAFVATPEGDGEIRLDRVIAVEGLPPLPGQEGGEQDAFIHFTAYQEMATTFERARELAQRHDLTPATENYVRLASAIPSGWRIVWFRSLSEDERP